MPGPLYFESLMLIFFSLNWYWSIARMLRTKESGGKSVNANLLIALGYVAAICAKVTAEDELPVVFYICIWNLGLTLLDLGLIVRYRGGGVAARV